MCTYVYIYIYTHKGAVRHGRLGRVARAGPHLLRGLPHGAALEAHAVWHQGVILFLLYH